MTAMILLELEIEFPTEMIITPAQAKRFIASMRKVAGAGAVAALSQVMNETTTFSIEPPSEVYQS